GNAESLQAEFAACNRRQIAFFLGVAAVTQDCAHGVHLSVTCSAVSTGSVYLLQNCGSGAKIESAAAIFFGDQRGEITRFRQSRDEFGRVSAVAIQRAPVFSGKLGAQRAYTVPNIGKFLLSWCALFHG